MIRNTKLAKIAAVAAGFSMALTSAMPVGAVTIAELQAQIAALMAQLNALQGGTTTTVAVSFTRDLTIGSSGAEVTALQQTLVAQGYLTMPAGVAYGYFGSLTKSAVARWQAAVGLPATGFFGPMSRAKLNAVGGTTTGGTTSGGATGSTGGITTPGAEGTLTVTSAPVSDTSLNEGDSMVPVLAFQAKAVQSDIALQRVKIDLGSNTSLYNKILSKVYLVDDSGKTLASSDLNSSTVVKDGDYYLTLSGFSTVVPKGATRVYTIKADVRGSIDSSDRTGSKSVVLPVNGVRGVDGAGIDLYGPTSAITATFTVSASELESASLTVTASASTPAVREIIAADGTNDDEADKVVLLSFDMKAEKDSVKVTELTATTTVSGTNTSSTTVLYLYAGSNTSGQLLGSVAPSASTGSFTATFDNLSYTISKDATQTFTIAGDVRNANSAATTYTTSVTGSTGIEAENSIGDTVTASGSATGNNVVVRNVGPQVTLSSKSISRDSGVAIAGGTSSALATFNIDLKAVGGDVYFGPQASSTFAFQTYYNGAATTLLVSSSTSWSVSSGGGVVTSGNGITSGGFKLTEGSSVTVPVQFYFQGRTDAGALISSGSYAVGLESVKWSTDGSVANQATTNFMAGKTDWRTTSVIMP